ncbi:MAG TPA: DUF3426 domain-containing protein [Stellaceae bacterium]|jgi:predicted Zn finger-like uncharacterized protein
MIVTCPACSTRYLVDGRALGANGRVVRCAQCSHTWHQTPPDDMARPVDLASPPNTPDLDDTDRPVQLPALPRKRRFPWAAVGWLIFLALLGAATIGTVMARDDIVAKWPPAARLYAMVGLPVEPPGAGLDFRKVSQTRITDNGKPALQIEGEIVNVSNVARDVPKLRIALKDRSDRELQSWTFPATEERLLPGASVPFRTTIPNPSEAATGVVVTFTSGG